MDKVISMIATLMVIFGIAFYAMCVYTADKNMMKLSDEYDYYVSSDDRIPDNNYTSDGYVIEEIH